MKTIWITLLLCLIAVPVTTAANSQLPKNWTFEVSPKQEVNREANTEVLTDSIDFDPEPQSPENITSGRVVEFEPHPSGLENGLELEPISPTKIVLIPDTDEEEWSDEPDAAFLPDDLEEGGEESVVFPEAVLMESGGCSLTTFSSSALDPSWMLMLILGFPWGFRRIRK